MVLIIENRRDLAMRTHDAFKWVDRRFRVDIASTVQAALESTKRSRPRLIVVNPSMPGISKFCIYVAQHLPRAKIVGLGAKVNEHHSERIESNPFNKLALVELMTRVRNEPTAKEQTHRSRKTVPLIPTTFSLSVTVSIVGDNLRFSLKVPDDETVKTLCDRLGRTPDWFNIVRDGTDIQSALETNLQNGDHIELRLPEKKSH